MAIQVQLRRGTAAQNNAFTGAIGELSFDTTANQIRVHDGSTAGGFKIGIGDFPTGTNNIALGNTALDDLDGVSPGGNNTAIGHDALTANTTASFNTAIGVSSGSLITTGQKNTIVGSFDGNEGGLDIRTSSNYIVLSDGDGNPRLIIDNNGNVDIGDATTELKLKNTTHEDTEGGRESKITFQGEQSGGEQSVLAQIQASHDGTGDDEKADLIFRTNDGSDGTSPTEAARIDSDRNFLVGKTSADNTTQGVRIYPTGRQSIVSEADISLIVNRRTSDGTIVEFRKTGSEVGSIGIQSTGFYIDGESGHAGLRFAGNEISPRDNGADADDAISLGESDKRFTNAYLSGGVFLGGVAAANRLDDYEEGLHSPTLSGSTSGSVSMRSGYQQLSYQVVGNRCTMTGRWEVSGGHSLVGNVKISLPFATANLTDQAGVGVGTIFLHRTGTDFDQGVVFGLVAFEGESAAYIYYQPSGTGNEALVQGSQLDSNFEGFINISYPLS
tara:strand:- start:533 stop:2032 length:1500 start_codon:yes stop_codon:yes gene_type:complete